MDIKSINYRAITEADSSIIATDKADFKKRAILPFVAGGVAVGLGILAPISTRSQGTSLTFIGVIVIAFLAFAVACFVIGIKRVAPAHGICEAVVMSKRKQEFSGAVADGETKIAHYFTLKPSDSEESFETFVEDEEYAKANVGDKVFILEIGKNTHRVVVPNKN